jgi:hypothetical protein
MNTLRLRFAALAMCTFGTSYAVQPNSVALGPGALALDISPGDYNTAVGANAMGANTTGDNNVAVGYAALATNATGIDNVAVGYGAMFLDTTGFDNTALGWEALYSNTTGYQNTALGLFALYANTTANYNNAVGYEALYANTTGIQNNAMGAGALGTNTTGIDNTAVGHSALSSSTTASENTAVGAFALGTNTTGYWNSAMGAYSLEDNTTGGYNSALGKYALSENTSGSNNSAVGTLALYKDTTGSNNVGIGYKVGFNTLSTGSNNVLIGTTSAIDTAVPGTSNTIQIGAGSTCIWCVTGTGTPATAVETFTGSIAFPNVTTGTNADFVCMAAGGVLTLQASACTISSLRFKEHVRPFIGDALSNIEQLEVDSFNIKPTEMPNADTNFSTRQIGLIAENIAKVLPDCAIYENDMNTPKSYRQECVIAMLVKGEQQLVAQNAMLKARLSKLEHHR